MNANKSEYRASTIFTQAEIGHLYKEAQSVLKEQGLHIRVAPKTSEHARILIVIPKKVGSAVERNALRRMIKHSYFEQKLWQQAYDAILNVFPEAKRLDFHDISAILRKALVSA